MNYNNLELHSGVMDKADHSSHCNSARKQMGAEFGAQPTGALAALVWLSSFESLKRGFWSE